MSGGVAKIFYINLSRRPDRKLSIESELRRVGMWEKSERIEAVDVPGFGCLGCGKSHLAALKLARERGYENVLILEDDLKFTVESDELQSELSALFSSGVEFGACLLAYNLIRSGPVEGVDFLLRVQEAQTASAYLVTATMYDELIDLYEDATVELEKTRMHWIYANDQAWKRLQAKGNWYCFKKRLGVQAAGWSDNARCVVDYGC